MYWSLSSWYRNVNYPSSYDEIPLSSGYFKQLDLAAWSPDLVRDGSGSNNLVSGSLNFDVGIEAATDNNPNPIRFYESGVYPQNGDTSPISFSVGISVGYVASASASYDVGYQDPDGASINLSGTSVTGKIGWNTLDGPSSGASAIGARIGIGSLDGTPAFYRVGTDSTFNYKRWYCDPELGCFSVPYSLKSDKQSTWVGLQVGAFGANARFADGNSWDITGVSGVPGYTGELGTYVTDYRQDDMSGLIAPIFAHGVKYSNGGCPVQFNAGGDVYPNGYYYTFRWNETSNAWELLYSQEAIPTFDEPWYGAPPGLGNLGDGASCAYGSSFAGPVFDPKINGQYDTEFVLDGHYVNDINWELNLPP